MKQTEIGWIPVDWSCIELGRMGVFSKGKGINKAQAQSGDIDAVRYGELYTVHHNVIRKTVSTISKDVAVQSKRLKSGDILFAGSGETKAEIGKAAVFIGEKPTYAGGDIIVFTATGCNSVFLSYQLNSSAIQTQKASYGQGDAVVHIYANSLSKILVGLPPLSEQQAIAEALSDADAWIESLEALLQKKLLIKQGAMLELLKPKEEWEVKKLDDIALYAKSGGTPLSSNKEYYNGEIPFLSISDMTEQGKYLTRTSNKISQKGIENSASWLVPKYSIIYSMYASVGFVSINRIELATSQAVLNFIINKDYNIEFVYYVLVSMQNQVLKYVGEGTQKNLNAQTVKNFEISIPKSIEEQNSIAIILSDMDNEIEILKQKLSKAHQIKQGMMQQLLTGQIRLVKPESEEAVKTSKRMTA